MTRDQIFLMIRKYRILFVVAFIVSFSGAGYFLIPYVIVHKSMATFYLANSDSQINPAFLSGKGREEFLQVNQAQERAYQLIFSTEMQNHLIRQFNLYRIYKIDSTKNFHYEKVLDKLSKNVSFTNINSDLSQITVKDRNRERAANMANAIVAKLDQLNKQYIANKTEAGLRLYDAYLNESTKISSEQNMLLKQYMTIFSNSRNNHAGSLNYKPLSEVEFSLYQSAAKIEDINQQLALAKILYSKALEFQKSKELSSLIVIKKALPDVESKKDLLAGLAFMAGILGMAVTIITVYFFHAYSNEIRLVFGISKPTDELIEKVKNG